MPLEIGKKFFFKWKLAAVKHFPCDLQSDRPIGFSVSVSKSDFTTISYPLPIYVITMEANGSGTMTSEQVEGIRNEMFDSFTSSILPSVLQEVTPMIRNKLVSELMPLLKKEIVDATTAVITQIKNEVTNDVHWRQFSSSDVHKFLTENADILNKHEAQRDNALCKAKRLEHLIKLNAEQLRLNPPYVPRKFRKDKYHVRSERELSVLKNREMNDMKSEMEIWELRLKENKQRVQHQDDLVEIFVTEHIQNPYIKEEVIKEWNKNNRKEEERVE